MEDKNELDVLEDFNYLSKYLEKEGKIKNSNRYKKDFSAFLLHANHIRAYDFVAPFCKDKKVLDVGCFIGYGEKRIFEQAKEVIAIDNDEKALEYARQKNKSIPNVKFEKVDARQLPFSDEIFDIIIAFQLIEHIPPNEISNFLREAKRILKNRGLLFITTPNRKFRLLPLQQPFNLEHYQEFTVKRLFRILKTVFNEVEIKGIRAKEWLEEIEKKRVRKPPYQAYIQIPLFRFLNIILPAGVKTMLKKHKPQRTKSPRPKNEIFKNNNEFNNLFQKFTMDDFFLVNRVLDQSMGLFAICKK